MCSSKRPQIPDSRTPPAPNAPEASPDAPNIGTRDREYALRGRGFKIKPVADLSGLGNQDVKSPNTRLTVGKVANPADRIAELEAELAVANARNPPPPPRQTSGKLGGRGGF